MKPSSTRTVKSQSSDQQYPRDSIRCLRHAGSRQIMVNKALRHKTREQALHHALLEIHLNHFLGDDARILEHNRPNWRGAAPLPEFLISGPGGTETIHALSP